jgi:hypothetical protein
MKKRLSSMEHYHETVGQMAGFLVRQCQMKPEKLALYDLIRPKHVEAFAHWKIQRRGMVTRTVHNDVSRLARLSENSSSARTG